MECKKCGKELDEAWIACPFCATKIAKARAKKRGNKEGSVYKRGKTWTARITTETYLVDGKVKQKRPSKGGFATKAEASMYLSTLKKAPSKKVPSLETYYDTYLNGKMAKLSESKKTAYKIAWNKLQQVKSLPIDTISVGDLQLIINEKCPTYYPARDMRVLLNQLYKLAAAEGNANPALPGLLELPSLEEKEQEPFTEEEQKLLWKSYEAGNINAALPLIMIYTGMMPGEMRILETSMIIWDEQKIVGAGLKTKIRKKSAVLLSDSIMPVLESVANGKEGRLYPMNEDDFYALYYHALTDAGITRHLTPYSCRHTTATALAIDKTVAPQTVMRIMRWSSTKQLDRYAHPSDTDARQALDSL